MRNLSISVAASAAALVLSLASPVSAHVATISGSYDDTSHGEPYDTPELFFNNTSAHDFTNVTLQLKAYQGLNNGVTQSVAIPDIVAGTIGEYVWTGSTTPGNLFAYDYDDEFGASGSAQPGNFSVTFTATWDGQSIFSVFSPANNVTGGFVGWEGLDQNGFAETAYDAHSGTPGGTLAYIDIGTPGVPEPATWALMLTGLLSVGGALRYVRRSAATAVA